MAKLIILQGIPGSGKSTFAAKYYPDAVVCNADSFRIRPDGVYDMNHHPDPHGACFEKFMEAVRWNRRGGLGEQDIVIDNTNTQAWELTPYLNVGKYAGMECILVRFDVPYEVGMQRNIHSVPPWVMTKMYDRLKEPLPKAVQDKLDKCITVGPLGE